MLAIVLALTQGLWRGASGRSTNAKGDSMLYSTDSQKYVVHIPHESEYRIWTGRLSDEEFRRIYDELTRRVEGDEIHTSSWIPGSDWGPTPFQPIYEKACRYDEESAAMCFGLFLWQVLMEREDVWGFLKCERDGIPIRGMTYFKIHNPPPR